MNYKHDFAAKGHKLSSELRFDEHFEGGPTDILDQSLWPTTAPPTTTLQQTRTVWTHSSGTSLKLDYVQPFAAGWRLETGYKGFFQRIRTTQDVQNFDAAQSRMLTDTTQTSDFSYDELVHDAYTMPSRKSAACSSRAGFVPNTPARRSTCAIAISDTTTRTTASSRAGSWRLRSTTRTSSSCRTPRGSAAPTIRICSILRRTRSTR